MPLFHISIQLGASWSTPKSDFRRVWTEVSWNQKHFLGSGFKYIISNPTWGNDPIWLIFINQFWMMFSLLKVNVCLFCLFACSPQLESALGFTASQTWAFWIWITSSLMYYPCRCIGEVIGITRWWFQTFSIFTCTWGNGPIWRAYLSDGLVQTPTR